MPLQTNLIAYSSHAHEVREWYYYPEPSADSKAGAGRADHAEDSRAGPISKDELKMYYAKEKVRAPCFRWSSSWLKTEKWLAHTGLARNCLVRDVSCPMRDAPSQGIANAKVNTQICA